MSVKRMLQVLTSASEPNSVVDFFVSMPDYHQWTFAGTKKVFYRPFASSITLYQKFQGIYLDLTGKRRREGSS